MPEPIPKLPVQLIEHIAGHRHVTTFEPEMAVAKMKVRGFELLRWHHGAPVFRGVTALGVKHVLAFEAPPA